MKRILILTLLTLSVCVFAQSEEPKWYSWNEGYELSKKENKPMLIFVHATWCNMCKRLEEKTFNDKGVSPLINKNFIPVKFDVEAKQEYTVGDAKVGPGKILSTISIDASKGLAIPTTVFWYADSKNARSVTGLKDPREMKKLLRQNR